MRMLLLLILQLSVGPIFSQNDTCSVQISLDTTVIPRQLVTTVTGASPFLYAWNNTRQTDKITLNQSGNYNVTITDATGCISTAEFNYDQCDVTIVEDTTDNGILLRAEVTGTPPFQYFWGDDTRTETAIPNGTGNYVVTITDGTGCDAAVEYDYIDHDSTNQLIEGRIRNRGNNRDILFEGTVFLYQKSSALQYELVDSVSFGSAGEWSPFSFGEVDAGTYILQAVLHSTSDGFDEFMPTYYGPTTQWQNARLVHIPYSGTRSADMGMSRKKLVAGNGFISGTLTEKDNFQANGDSRNQGNLSDYTILVLNEMDRAINSTVTDELGNFFFQNLALGNYKFLVEKIGYTSEIVNVEINETNPTIDGLRFLVDLDKKIITSQIINQNAPKTIAKNKIWQNVIYPTFNPETVFINYQFLNDTLINSQSYQQLFSKNLSSPQPKWKPLNTFLREIQDKIYILNSDLSESLLYDFSLAVNDTFHLQYDNYDCIFLVKAIDSLNLSSTEKRKRMTLIKANDPNPEQPEYGYNYWVEGIGSLTSLVDYGGSCYTDYSTNLLCFYDYRALAYENPSIGNCLLTNTKEPLIKPIKIFPNPSHHSIFIETSDEIVDIQIFDILGRKMELVNNKKEVNITPLEKGIYWIKILTQFDYLFTEKIIKN